MTRMNADIPAKDFALLLNTGFIRADPRNPRKMPWVR
jgi:hypothetical protein